MARKHNTDKNGGSWSASIIIAVWRKASIIPNYLPDHWRKDICGDKIKFSEYGNRDSEYGWEVDHINPVSNSGSDDINNLQPLHWSNNVKKADNLNWSCEK